MVRTKKIFNEEQRKNLWEQCTPAEFFMKLYANNDEEPRGEELYVDQISPALSDSFSSLNEQQISGSNI